MNVNVQYLCRKWCFHLLCLNLFQPNPWIHFVDNVSDLFLFSSWAILCVTSQGRGGPHSPCTSPTPSACGPRPALESGASPPPPAASAPASQICTAPAAGEAVWSGPDNTNYLISIFTFNCIVANDINISSHLSGEVESKLGGCCRNDGGLVPPAHHHEVLQPQQVLSVLARLLLPLIVDVRQVDAAIQKISVIKGVMPVLRRGNQI